MAERSLLCRRAFLPDGWAHNVRLRFGADGLITEVLPDCRDHAGESVGIALPGMPNAHSHAFQRAMAGLAEHRTTRADSFWTWRDTMYWFADRLEPGDMHHIAAQVYVEMLKGGFTSVAEFHYVHHDRNGKPYAEPAALSLALLDAAAQIGIGQTLLPVLYVGADFGRPQPAPAQRRFANSADALLNIVNRCRLGVPTPDRQRVGLALHSLRAVPPEAAREALAGIDAVLPAAPVHIHVAEQTGEVKGCLTWSGKRPVRWLLDNLPVDERWCLIHATHVEADEVRAMAQRGAVVGLCPTTEANLGDGVFPLRAVLDAGGRIAIGSDSNVSVSVVEELRWLEYGQRLIARARNVAADGDAMHTGEALYRRALEGGRRALGQPVGRLEAGSRADLIVLDDASPLLANTPDHALLDTFVFAGNQPLVRDVMVAGRWYVKDFHHHAEAAVRADYLRTVGRLRQT
ncbi:MAG: formimidoylglutamate deiminase [Pseudomonadota bacterium]